jgi:hypothetical protein
MCVCVAGVEGVWVEWLDGVEGKVIYTSSIFCELLATLFASWIVVAGELDERSRND